MKFEWWDRLGSNIVIVGSILNRNPSEWTQLTDEKDISNLAPPARLCADFAKIYHHMVHMWLWYRCLLYISFTRLSVMVDILGLLYLYLSDSFWHADFSLNINKNNWEM